MLQPLNVLLKEKVKWEWSNKCDEAFQLAKECLMSSKVLAHYDVSIPIRLACDQVKGWGTLIKLAMES